MTQNTASPSSKTTPPPTQNKVTPPRANLARVPPEEQFWKRYSAHHEFPLSNATSLAAHILVAGVLLLGLWVAARYMTGKDKSLEVNAVTIVGGGGGNPKGVGGGPGQGDTTLPEAVEPDKVTDPTKQPTPQPELKLDSPLDPLDVPKFQKPDGSRYIQGGEAIKALASVGVESRKKMFAAVAGKGQGGTGSGGGGPGTGTGTGQGSGVGTGKGELTQRQKRVLRWTMIFDTANGEDYARQLSGLGAILAIPLERGDNPEYRVVRNLMTRPATGDKEDLSSINRIFWIDSKPESVQRLSSALRLRPAPDYIVAFFPEELENKLLDLETRYNNGKNEDDIQETQFRIVVRGGQYEPLVVHSR
jgi:hypothetical protein